MRSLTILGSVLIVAAAILTGRYLDHVWHPAGAGYQLVQSGINGAAYRLNTATGQVDLCLVDKCVPVAEAAALH